MSTTIDTLRRAADHFPGGRVVASVRLGRNDEVHRKELGSSPTHKMGAADALALARLCCEAGTPHCHDYAAHVAEECGGKFTLGMSEEAAAVPPLNRVADLMRETSDVTTSVIGAMADGVITDNELAQIEREVAEAECVLRRLRQAARVVNLRGKPVALRTPTETHWLREHAGAAA